MIGCWPLLLRRNRFCACTVTRPSYLLRMLCSHVNNKKKVWRRLCPLSSTLLSLRRGKKELFQRYCKKKKSLPFAISGNFRRRQKQKLTLLWVVLQSRIRLRYAYTYLKSCTTYVPSYDESNVHHFYLVNIYKTCPVSLRKKSLRLDFFFSVVFVKFLKCKKWTDHYDGFSLSRRIREIWKLRRRRVCEELVFINHYYNTLPKHGPFVLISGRPCKRNFQSFIFAR